MPRLQVKSFAAPDQLREFPLVRIETVELDEVHVGHCRFEPGWRWSTTFGPMMGTASCPIRHLGYTISGSLRVVMDDGQAMDLGPGSVFDIPPGHDKWVVGDEPWITVEWGGSGRAMGQAMQEPPDRQLATVLFTDIVDSTAQLRAVGDAAWRDQLAAHNARLREQLNVFRGREVKTTGDGLLAMFDSPTRAVRVPRRWSPPATRWAWRSGSECTPARWSWSGTTSAGSPSTWPRACWPWQARVRCS